MSVDQHHSCKLLLKTYTHLELPEEKVHFEFFGPAVQLELTYA